MAMVTLLSALLSFILTLAADVFALIPFYNFWVATIMGMGLVVGKLDYQVAVVLLVVISSIPLFVIFFAVLDAFSTVVYRAATGFY